MSATGSKPKAQAKKLKGNTGGNAGKAKGKGKNKTWNNKSKDETDKSKGELATFVKKAVKDGLKQELKAIDKKCKSDSDDSSMDLHAIDVELQEFNYDDMEKLVIKDPEHGEVDDASISTEMSVWKTGQDKIENSERVKQDKLYLNLSPKFLDTVGKPE